MSLLDTTGGYSLDRALAGTKHGDGPIALNTFVNAGAAGTVNAAGGIDGAGTVDFGVAVADGTDEGTVVPFSATDGSQKIRGITSRLAHMSASLPGNLVGYPSGAELSVFVLGEVNVVAAEDVRKDDAVLALSTPYAHAHGTTNLGGTKGGAANGTTRVLMTGHKWKAAYSQGEMGVVQVLGLQPAATLTT
jgi:hypothetical protein